MRGKVTGTVGPGQVPRRPPAPPPLARARNRTLALPANVPGGACVLVRVRGMGWRPESQMPGCFGEVEPPGPGPGCLAFQGA